MAIAGEELVYETEIAVLRPQGRLDAFQAPLLAQSLTNLEESGNHFVVVNMRDVDFIDSVALSTLVQGLKRALQSGGELYLCEIRQPVRIIFELTRLDKAFYLFESEQEALLNLQVKA